MESRKVAVIVGTGPGLGCALAQRFARAEMHVAMASRHPERLDALAAECSGIGHGARSYRCDATLEESVLTLFRQVREELGEPDVVVYNAGAFVHRSVLETSAEEFEAGWRVGCLGGFLVGQEAARGMLRRVEGGGPGGTLLFTGATASLRGGAGFQNFAVGKFGLRALAQSMARELQPKGIHVAHVVIDGRIRPTLAVERERAPACEEMLDPAAIAEAYYQLHLQSKSAWTQEMDLRPWVEKF